MDVAVHPLRGYPVGSVHRALEHPDGRAFVGDPPERLRVRYSPRVARWIAERERERGTPNGDGSLDVEYPLGDAEWAIRHVLQYGPDAEVLAPEWLRERTVARLREITA